MMASHMDADNSAEYFEERIAGGRENDNLISVDYDSPLTSEKPQVDTIAVSSFQKKTPPRTSMTTPSFP